MSQSDSWWRRLLILPPLVLGVIVFVLLVQAKQDPQPVSSSERARPVRVVPAARIDFTPRVRGHGPVRPAQVWVAVAQVSGRILSMHPRLDNGEILPLGSELIRIDPVDYQIALDQAEAQLMELLVQEQNARASLAIEQRKLDLAKREQQRILKLLERGTTTRSNADEAERAMLTAQSAVQNLENTLAQIPAQRKVLESQRARARRDLGRTVIKAPFNMRVAGLSVETDQFVPAGQRLVEGDSLDQVEVVAQYAMSELRRLFLGMEDRSINLTSLGQQLSQLAELRPQVELDLGGALASWEARFVRISDQVDERTRTVGVVVAVDKPYEQVVPGLRPPLSKGMFVRVALQGRVQPGRVVIPRSAVRAGQVLLVDKENRLRRRPVDLLFDQDRLSVVASGLVGGEAIVVSDLVPAVEGMLLAPEVDREFERYLQDAGSKL